MAKSGGSATTSPATAGLALFDKWLSDRIGLKYKPEIDAFLLEREEYTRKFDQIFGA
jgi:hypothetical protein